jgi:hypothetical protein
VGEPAATLAAEAGVADFKVGFERWIAADEERAMSQLIRESLDELKAVAAAGQEEAYPATLPGAAAEGARTARAHTARRSNAPLSDRTSFRTVEDPTAPIRRRRLLNPAVHGSAVVFVSLGHRGLPGLPDLPCRACRPGIRGGP